MSAACYFQEFAPFSVFFFLFAGGGFAFRLFLLLYIPMLDLDSYVTIFAVIRCYVKRGLRILCLATGTVCDVGR